MYTIINNKLIVQLVIITLVNNLNAKVTKILLAEA